MLLLEEVLNRDRESTVLCPEFLSVYGKIKSCKVAIMLLP